MDGLTPEPATPGEVDKNVTPDGSPSPSNDVQKTREDILDVAVIEMNDEDRKDAYNDNN